MFVVYKLLTFFAPIYIQYDNMFLRFIFIIKKESTAFKILKYIFIQFYRDEKDEIMYKEIN